jgi:hypothetical protein
MAAQNRAAGKILRLQRDRLQDADISEISLSSGFTAPVCASASALSSGNSSICSGDPCNSGRLRVGEVDRIGHEALAAEH